MIGHWITSSERKDPKLSPGRLPNVGRFRLTLQEKNQSLLFFNEIFGISLDQRGRVSGRRTAGLKNLDLAAHGKNIARKLSMYEAHIQKIIRQPHLRLCEGLHEILLA